MAILGETPTGMSYIEICPAIVILEPEVHFSSKLVYFQLKVDLHFQP